LAVKPAESNLLYFGGKARRIKLALF